MFRFHIRRISDQKYHTCIIFIQEKTFFWTQCATKRFLKGEHYNLSTHNTVKNQRKISKVLFSLKWKNCIPTLVLIMEDFSKQFPVFFYKNKYNFYLYYYLTVSDILTDWLFSATILLKQLMNFICSLNSNYLDSRQVKNCLYN